MAKDNDKSASKEAAKKQYCVSLPDYPMHPPVTTEGTPEEAVKAFQAKHGLDSLNLQWKVEEVA